MPDPLRLRLLRIGSGVGEGGRGAGLLPCSAILGIVGIKGNGLLNMRG